MRERAREKGIEEEEGRCKNGYEKRVVINEDIQPNIKSVRKKNGR